MIMIMHRNPFGSAKTFLLRCYSIITSHHHMHKLKRIEIYPAICTDFEKSKTKTTNWQTTTSVGIAALSFSAIATLFSAKTGFYLNKLK